MVAQLHVRSAIGLEPSLLGHTSAYLWCSLPNYAGVGPAVVDMVA